MKRVQLPSVQSQQQHTVRRVSADASGKSGNFAAKFLEILSSLRTLAFSLSLMSLQLGGSGFSHGLVRCSF
jgi:hypothetical protein